MDDTVLIIAIRRGFQTKKTGNAQSLSVFFLENDQITVSQFYKQYVYYPVQVGGNIVRFNNLKGLK